MMIKTIILRGKEKAEKSLKELKANAKASLHWYNRIGYYEGYIAALEDVLKG